MTRAFASPCTAIRFAQCGSHRFDEPLSRELKSVRRVTGRSEATTPGAACSATRSIRGRFDSSSGLCVADANLGILYIGVAVICYAAGWGQAKTVERDRQERTRACTRSTDGADQRGQRRTAIRACAAPAAALGWCYGGSVISLAAARPGGIGLPPDLHLRHT